MKLADQKIGCVMVMRSVSLNISGIISAGGENSLTIHGNNGRIIAEITIKKTVDSPIKDLINFLASGMLPFPIHWPTTVTTAILSALPPIWNNIEIEPLIALTVIASVPSCTIKVCVSSLPPLKNICSAAKGTPMIIIFLSNEKSIFSASLRRYRSVWFILIK